jgi:hypothetical protein
VGFEYRNCVTRQIGGRMGLNKDVGGTHGEWRICATTKLVTEMGSE